MAEAWRGFLKRLKKACMCKLAPGRFRSYGLKSQDEVPKQGEEEEENSDPECGVLISGPRFARGLWLWCQEKIQRLPGLPKRTLRTRKEFQMSKRSTTRFLFFLLHGQEPRRPWKLRWTRSCPKTLRGRFWWHKIENRACSCCNGLKLHVCKRDVIKVVEEIGNWKYRAVSPDNCQLSVVFSPASAVADGERFDFGLEIGHWSVWFFPPKEENFVLSSFVACLSILGVCNWDLKRIGKGSRPCGKWKR